MSNKGLYNKYIVLKMDGSPIDKNADYFVLRLDTDPIARTAAIVYAQNIEGYNRDLANDLKNRVSSYE